jgi:hypothetical protein
VRPHAGAGIDDHEITARPGRRLAVGAQHPHRRAGGKRLVVVGIDDGAPVEPDVQRGRNADAALGCNTTEARLEPVRVGRVHLQPHRAEPARTPAALGNDPSEVEHPHPPHAVAADAVRVERALGAKVRIGWRVPENAERGTEVLE